MNITVKKQRYIIPYRTESALVEKFNGKKGDYGNIGETLKQELLGLIEEHKNTFYYAQLVSLREQIIKNKNTKNIRYMKPEVLIEMYQSGKTVREISEATDISPLKITEVVLPKDFLTDADFGSYLYAHSNDITRTQSDGTEFELEVTEKLKQWGVKFKTQEELIVEQTVEKGQAYCTPDFLILSDFKIGGNVAKWIEVKSFYGTVTPMFFNNIRDQVEKYVKQYGEGILIFKHGYTQNNLIILNFIQ